MPVNENRSWDDIISYIQTKLGHNVRNLELSPQDIMNTISKRSMVTFSKYFPRQYYHHIDYIKDKIPGAINEYYLRVPDDITVLGVAQVLETNLTQNIPVDFNIVTNPFDSQMLHEMYGYYVIPTFVTFKSPNVAVISNSHNIYKNILTELNIVHTNPITIKPALYEHFRDLCLYDIADDVLAQREVYQNYRNAFGEFNMNLDRLQRYADKRAELIETFRQQFTRSYHQKIWVF